MSCSAQKRWLCSLFCWGGSLSRPPLPQERTTQRLTLKFEKTFVGSSAEAPSLVWSPAPHQRCPALCVSGLSGNPVRALKLERAGDCHGCQPGGLCSSALRPREWHSATYGRSKDVWRAVPRPAARPVGAGTRSPKNGRRSHRRRR
jgi:hypothetical protein